MCAARKRQSSECWVDHDASDSESESQSESDVSDYAAPSPRKGRAAKRAKTSNGKASKAAPAPTTKAGITILATDVSSDQAQAKARLEHVEPEVLSKIRKALALGSHEGTGEEEAKQALRMASKLMAKHSVNQADVLAQETDAEKLQRAGTSVVSVRPTDARVREVRLEVWAGRTAGAITDFFDCQMYTTRFGTRCEFSFYGLAEQTVAAATAFEMVYNLISAWSLESRVAKGRNGKNAYRNGVARGLRKLAQDEKENERKAAIVREQRLLEAKRREEEEEDKRRLERLQDPPPTQEDIKPKTEAVEETIPALVPPEEATAAEVKPDPDAEDTPEGKFKVKMEEVDDDDAPLKLKSPPEDEVQGRRESISAPPSPLTPVAARGDDYNMENGYAYDAAGVDAEGGGEYAAADFDDDDDSDAGDAPKPLLGDLNTDPPVSLSMPPPPLPIKKEEEEEEEDPDEPSWSSLGQLIAFRETSVAVGDEYLKKEGIKLRKARKTKPLQFKDAEALKAYKMGQEDAKKIDVRGKRIKGVDQD